MSRGRTFSREFKLAVCRQIATGERRSAQVCREHALAESLLVRWRHEYETRGATACTPDETSPGTARCRIGALVRPVGAGACGPKKGAQHASRGERQAMITALHAAEPALSIRQLCQRCGVGRTGSYTHPRPEDRAARARDLRDAIEAIALAHPGSGDRRVTKQLPREAWRVNHKRVLRIMRQECLLCQLKRGFGATTNAAHGYRRYLHLIKEVVLDHLDQVCVADITSIRLPRAFVSLAAVLAASSRRCLGWQLARTIATQLPLAAREHALTLRQPAPGLIHHSDQGGHDASADYVARLGTAGLHRSMAAVGNP